MKTIVGVVTSLVLVASGTPQTVSADELSPTLRPLRQVERQPTPSVLQTRRAWFQKLVASFHPVSPDASQAKAPHLAAPQAEMLMMSRRRAIQLTAAGATALGLNPAGFLTKLPPTETVAVPPHVFAQLSSTYLSSAGEELFGIFPILMRQLDAIFDSSLLRQSPDAALPMIERYIVRVVKISVGSLDRPPFILPSKQEMGVLRQFFSSEENMRHLRDNPWVRRFQAGRPHSFFPMATEPDRQTKEQINQMFQEWDAEHPVDEATLRKAFNGMRELFAKFDQEAYQRTLPRAVKKLASLAEKDERFSGVARVMQRFQEAGAPAAAEEPWFQEQLQKREALSRPSGEQQSQREIRPQDAQEPRDEESPFSQGQTDLPTLPVLQHEVDRTLPLVDLIEHRGIDAPVELHLTWRHGELVQTELVDRRLHSQFLSNWQRQELEAWWPAEVPRPESMVMVIPFEPQSDWLAVLHRLRVAFELVSPPAGMTARLSSDALLTAL